MTNSTVYVNRESQIKLIQEVLSYIRTIGAVFQNIFEFIGIPTIGKTVLINLLCSVCHEVSIPFTHIDFDQNRNTHAADYLNSPALLLVDLATQLRILNQPGLFDAVQAYEKLIIPDDEKRRQALQRIAQAFRNEVIKLLECDTLAFLFDSTELAHPAVLSFLEEEVIAPLTQKGRCIFIFAGRAALHWRRFEVRRRVRTEKLEPFELAAVEEQIEQSARRVQELTELSTQIYHLTGGLPQGNFVVTRKLDQLALQGTTLTPQTFSGHEPELIDALIKEIIDAHVFKDIPVELKESYYVLALVRQFDLILLRRLLSKFVKAYKTYPINAYGGILGKLNAIYLIDWDDKRKGYCVDPALRRILNRQTQLHNPQRYIAVNREALSVYQDWIKRVTDYRSIYIVEALYHEACLACIEGQCVYDRFQESIEGYLANYDNCDPELLPSMLERLDKELAADLVSDRLGGLGELLPAKVTEQLREVIHSQYEKSQEAKRQTVSL